jgi:hypothetical protein
MQRTPPGTKTLPKQWPDKIEAFRVGRWRVDHLDQEMMRTIRKIADKRGSTIEEVMDQALLDFVQRCVADSELSGKIIPFPIKRRPNPNSSSGYRQTADFVPQKERSMPKASIEKPRGLRLTRGIKTVA